MFYTQHTSCSILPIQDSYTNTPAKVPTTPSSLIESQTDFIAALQRKKLIDEELRANSSDPLLNTGDLSSLAVHNLRDYFFKDYEVDFVDGTTKVVKFGPLLYELMDQLQLGDSQIQVVGSSWRSILDFSFLSNEFEKLQVNLEQELSPTYFESVSRRFNTRPKDLDVRIILKAPISEKKRQDLLDAVKVFFKTKFGAEPIYLKWGNIVDFNLKNHYSIFSLGKVNGFSFEIMFVDDLGVKHLFNKNALRICFKNDFLKEDFIFSEAETESFSPIKWVTGKIPLLQILFDEVCNRAIVQNTLKINKKGYLLLIREMAFKKSSTTLSCERELILILFQKLTGRKGKKLAGMLLGEVDQDLIKSFRMLKTMVMSLSKFLNHSLVKMPYNSEDIDTLIVSTLKSPLQQAIFYWHWTENKTYKNKIVRLLADSWKNANLEGEFTVWHEFIKVYLPDFPLDFAKANSLENFSPHKLILANLIKSKAWFKEGWDYYFEDRQSIPFIKFIDGAFAQNFKPTYQAFSKEERLVNGEYLVALKSLAKHINNKNIGCVSSDFIYLTKDLIDFRNLSEQCLLKIFSLFRGQIKFFEIANFLTHIPIKEYLVVIFLETYVRCYDELKSYPKCYSKAQEHLFSLIDVLPLSKLKELMALDPQAHLFLLLNQPDLALCEEALHAIESLVGSAKEFNMNIFLITEKYPRLSLAGWEKVWRLAQSSTLIKAEEIEELENRFNANFPKIKLDRHVQSQVFKLRKRINFKNLSSYKIRDILRQFKESVNLFEISRLIENLSVFSNCYKLILKTYQNCFEELLELPLLLHEAQRLLACCLPFTSVEKLESIVLRDIRRHAWILIDERQRLNTSQKVITALEEFILESKEFSTELLTLFKSYSVSFAVWEKMFLLAQKASLTNRQEVFALFPILYKRLGGLSFEPARERKLLHIYLEFCHQAGRRISNLEDDPLKYFQWTHAQATQKTSSTLQLVFKALFPYINVDNADEFCPFLERIILDENCRISLSNLERKKIFALLIPICSKKTLSLIYKEALDKKTPNTIKRLLKLPLNDVYENEVLNLIRKNIVDASNADLLFKEVFEADVIVGKLIYKKFIKTLFEEDLLNDFLLQPDVQELVFEEINFIPELLFDPRYKPLLLTEVGQIFLKTKEVQNINDFLAKHNTLIINEKEYTDQFCSDEIYSEVIYRDGKKYREITLAEIKENFYVFLNYYKRAIECGFAGIEDYRKIYLENTFRNYYLAKSDIVQQCVLYFASFDKDEKYKFVELNLKVIVDNPLAINSWIFDFLCFHINSGDYRARRGSHLDQLYDLIINHCFQKDVFISYYTKNVKDNNSKDMILSRVFHTAVKGETSLRYYEDLINQICLVENPSYYKIMSTKPRPCEVFPLMLFSPIPVMEASSRHFIFLINKLIRFLSAKEGVYSEFDSHLLDFVSFNLCVIRSEFTDISGLMELVGNFLNLVMPNHEMLECHETMGLKILKHILQLYHGYTEKLFEHHLLIAQNFNDGVEKIIEFEEKYKTTYKNPEECRRFLPVALENLITRWVTVLASNSASELLINYYIYRITRLLILFNKNRYPLYAENREQHIKYLLNVYGELSPLLLAKTPFKTALLIEILKSE